MTYTLLLSDGLSWFLFILIVGAMTLTSCFLLALRWKGWRSILQATAKKLGVQAPGGYILTRPSLHGEKEGCQVRVYPATNYNVMKRMPIRIVSFSIKFPALRTQLTIEPVGWLPRLGADAENDAQYRFGKSDALALVSAPDPHAARAILNPEARQIIADFLNGAVDRGFWITGTSVATDQFEHAYNDQERLTAGIESLLALVRILSRPGSTRSLLRENYLAEREPRSKTAYFESYAAVAGPLAAGDKLASDALKSKDILLKFAAARSIGADGFRFLPELLAAAGESLALDILEYAARQKTTSLVPFIISSKCPPFDWSVRSAIVDFFISVSDPRVETFLQRELGQVDDLPSSYMKKCIEALAERGTLDSIKLLHSLKNRLPAQEVDDAIAAIRRRLGADTTGGLSLAGKETDGGKLSLSEDAPEKGTAESRSEASSAHTDKNR